MVKLDGLNKLKVPCHHLLLHHIVIKGVIDYQTSGVNILIANYRLMKFGHSAIQRLITYQQKSKVNSDMVMFGLSQPLMH